jgi:hypothetical protein
MFEFIIALLLASSCPSSNSVAENLHLVKTPVAVVDTSGDHSHIPPDPFGRKYLPVPRSLTTVVDTSGDHSHIPPEPFGRKRILKA